MANTGYKGWATLEQYYTDNNAATGTTKANTHGQDGYVPAVYDITTCPLPAYTNYTYFQILGSAVWKNVNNNGSIISLRLFNGTKYAVTVYIETIINNQSDFSGVLSNSINGLFTIPAATANGAVLTEGTIDIDLITDSIAGGWSVGVSYYLKAHLDYVTFGTYSSAWIQGNSGNVVANPPI